MLHFEYLDFFWGRDIFHWHYLVSYIYFLYFINIIYTCAELDQC